EGSELMRPLAIAVVGGLFVSMFLTLFIIPNLYLIVNGISEKTKSFLTGSGTKPERQHAAVTNDGSFENPMIRGKE
ncbi:MAG: efflux RND transporter permease subunit, partial [Balneolales bacterium]